MIKFITIVFILFTVIASGQQTDSSDFRNRKKLVVLSHSAVYTGSMIALAKAWYANQPQTTFHWFNDGKEWNQVDKIGHSFSSYTVSNYCSKSFVYAGYPQKKSIIYGTATAFIYISSIEIFDGFSKGWGASPLDLAANFSGTALYATQQYFWNEQKILFKFSFHQTDYRKYRPELLGKTFIESILKDYNGQTYWLSANIHSFTRAKFIPKFLNISVGYHATGMTRGRDQKIDSEIYFSRERQFHLSLDVDFSRINAKRKWVKNLLGIINVIKVPFPSIEIKKTGMKFHPVYF